MKLAEIEALLGLRVAHATSQVEIAGVAHDSRSVRPGDLFVAIRGAAHDGHQYINDAVARGATAVLAEANAVVRHGPGVPILRVPSGRVALSILAAPVYNYPSRGMILAGVTGTNGKTSSTVMLQRILTATGVRAGTIGTLGAEFEAELLPTLRTTPEASDLQRVLAVMRSRGAEAVVMEASSHALDQGRTAGCEFNSVLFTNLTQDHMDYHPDMEQYFGAKRKLFTDYPLISAKSCTASVNADDPYGARLILDSTCPVISYGMGPGAQLRASAVTARADGTAFDVEWMGVGHHASLKVGGSFQVANALCAIGGALGLGVGIEDAIHAVESVDSVPGRFESVVTGSDFSVVVDYAHTPDGIHNLILAARKLRPRRLIIVFGCGGDRDRAKRPIMGGLAAAGADIAIVTSDNPRTEDPHEIIDEILGGMEGAAAKVIVQSDRHIAIRHAIELAGAGDMVLLAGKGDETYQEICGVRHPFDDRAVARNVLEERAQASS